jgi:hypothetical protein
MLSALHEAGAHGSEPAAGQEYTSYRALTARPNYP